LQQSSPFHSSSNADLVLPVLPEATPRLGVPERPARLLPGLEESQGALYEIGVADDGTLLGLVEDEMQESLVNLQAMAASLGCTTTVLRKLVVGTAEWNEIETESSRMSVRKDQLWVAEVLVSPASHMVPDVDVPSLLIDKPVRSPLGEASTEVEHAATQQIRVSFVGPSGAGKSSLIGTLSTSTLDNGRGKSRLSLLKHRHEISSGVSSSVAHELIGYQATGQAKVSVINYASGDVSTWVDIHNLANRLVLLTDSPGLPRYAKSTLRSLISWRPAWTILCNAADGIPDSSGPSGSERGEARDGTFDPYLDTCLRLELPFVIVLTKMDVANKAGLRSVLSRVLSILKAAGRKPIIMNSTPVGAATPELQHVKDEDMIEVNKIFTAMQSQPQNCLDVPILMTSMLTGMGVSKLHAFLGAAPLLYDRPAASLSSVSPATQSCAFQVDEVFSIPPSRVYSVESELRTPAQGIVLCGHLVQGRLAIGDVMLLGPSSADQDLAPSHGRSSGASSRSYGELSERAAAILSQARSYQGEPVRTLRGYQRVTSTFLPVRVVSLRTLRLPVQEMRHGETGTVGIEAASLDDQASALAKARKGMVLLDRNTTPTGYKAFSAAFRSSDFAQTNSPVLLLGGHALAYVNSIRATVKLSSIGPYDEPGRAGTSTNGAPVTPGEAGIFDFDSGDAAFDLASPQHGEEIRLTFKFVSTVEWISVGSEVLVVPTLTAAGPITGPASTSGVSGLSGFVGRICELFD
jgi:GTPase